MIDQYQSTPGSTGLQFQSNPDVVTQLPAFEWQQSFSPIIHLSESSINPRGGSSGRIDSSINALAWGTQDGHRISAPVIEIDHRSGHFRGGRWIFLNSELPTPFASSSNAHTILAALVTAAQQGAQDFRVEPSMPLYLPSEPIELQVSWMPGRQPPAAPTLQITITPEDHPEQRIVKDTPLTNDNIVIIPPIQTTGFHRIDVELRDAGKTIAIYHSGFWMRDESYLRSGPKLSVNANYFELNGRPLAVVGTTYMASDVHRLYYDHPNAYVWNRDLKEISDSGVNMLRTGWWSGWDKLCDENGVPYERTLRTMEAYLMTARKYGLPMQFNVFAFLPDVLGGENAYLDPAEVTREKNLYSAPRRPLSRRAFPRMGSHQ